MSDFSVLTNEEYSRICAAIPHGTIIEYFKKNPKEFFKIRPGFRATALKMETTVKLMVKFRQNSFISSFVEHIVNEWLVEISEAISDYQKDGETEISSYIRALSQSFFVNNISAYFKLSEKEFSDEDIVLIQNIISLLNDYDEKLQKIEDELEKTLQELNEYKSASKSAIAKSTRRLDEATSQIKKLNEKNDELKKIDSLYKDAQCNLDKYRSDVEELKKHNASLNEKLTALQDEICEIIKEKNELEISLRRKLMEEHKKELLPKVFTHPLHPIDMNEFIDYLQYNLESIGIKNEPDIPTRDILSHYLSDILFQGRPIVCDRAISMTLVSCVANALIGTPDVSRISFTSDITERTLRDLLETSKRIVVIDNFLGNFNDTILLTITDDYKNKIIFLTYSYSKTLKYLSEDLNAYCNFIGAIKVMELFIKSFPDEDPSTIEEEEYEPECKYYSNRYETILIRILKELNYCEKVINVKAINVSDERKLCELLVFDIIPYCFEVHLINPLNYSRTLQNYIKKSCYSKLLERWLNV